MIFLFCGCSYRHWSEASRESINIATPAAEQKETIFQIYVARAYAWRGHLGVHPWVAWKRPADKEYTVAQVTAWGISRTGSAVSVKQDLPDRMWFDNPPSIIFTATGRQADKIIQQTEKLIQQYPFKAVYRVYPGPNSNTFVDYIIRNTPELTVELPPTSIGKDFLVDSYLVDWSPGGKGVQVSAWGLLGFTVGATEGLELNLLGMTFGFDFLRPALKLPFVGRLGFKDAPL